MANSRTWFMSAVLVIAVAVSGCTADPPAAVSPSPETAGQPLPDPIPVAVGVPFDQALHDELIQMLERDQSGRMGDADPEGDRARTERLAQILAEHGWPTFDLVGEDGEDAAWAIAQHSDHDVAFQERALAYLRAAVEAAQGSPGNLAYLTDRVAANRGEAQVYGTQVGCVDGEAVPAPVEDEAGLEARRAELGLEPMSEYLALMGGICAEDG